MLLLRPEDRERAGRWAGGRYSMSPSLEGVREKDMGRHMEES